MRHPSDFPIEYPPQGWHYLGPWGDGHTFAHKNGLRVIVDCESKSDGKRWCHVSYSRKKWTPSHEDTTLVKTAFIGTDRYAYAVFPPTDQYVNIHSHCLHLWSRIDGNGQVLPEFAGEIAGVQSI